MLLTKKKDLRNRIAVLGGTDFFNSVTQSLSIRKFVRQRNLKNLHCKVPIKCIEKAAKVVPDLAGRAEARPRVDMGKKFAVENFGPKESRGAKVGCDRVSPPEHFFGLPFFDEQSLAIAGAGPNRGGDTPRFLFVVFDKLS